MTQTRNGDSPNMPAMIFEEAIFDAANFQDQLFAFRMPYAVRQPEFAFQIANKNRICFCGQKNFLEEESSPCVERQQIFRGVFLNAQEKEFRLWDPDFSLKMNLNGFYDWQNLLIAQNGFYRNLAAILASCIGTKQLDGPCAAWVATQVAFLFQCHQVAVNVSERMNFKFTRNFTNGRPQWLLLKPVGKKIQHFLLAWS